LSAVSVLHPLLPFSSLWLSSISSEADIEVAVAAIAVVVRHTEAMGDIFYGIVPVMLIRVALFFQHGCTNHRIHLIHWLL